MAETYEDRGVVSREPGAVVADSKPRPKGTRRRWFLRSWGVDDQRQDNGRTSFSGETILTGPRPSDKSATSRAKLGADSRRRWVATLTGVRVWGSRRLRRTRMIGESVRVAERRPDRVGAALGPAGRELLRGQVRLGSFQPREQEKECFDGRSGAHDRAGKRTPQREDLSGNYQQKKLPFPAGTAEKLGSETTRRDAREISWLRFQKRQTGRNAKFCQSI